MAQQVQDKTYEGFLQEMQKWAGWSMFEEPDHINPEDVWESKALFQEFREEILKQCDHGGLLSILWRAREQALRGQTLKVIGTLLYCRKLTPRKSASKPSPCAVCVHNTVLVQNPSGGTQMMTRESLRALDNARTVEKFLRQTDRMLQSRLEELCGAAGTATHG